MKNVHCQALADGSGVEIRFQGEMMMIGVLLPIANSDEFIEAFKTELAKAKTVHAALNPPAPTTKRNGKGKR